MQATSPVLYSQRISQEIQANKFRTGQPQFQFGAGIHPGLALESKQKPAVGCHMILNAATNKKISQVY